MVSKIGKAFRMDTSGVMGVVDRIGEMNTVKDYCHTVSTIIDSTRTNAFSPGVLYSIVAQGWGYGPNSNEVLACAVEHPPTFLNLLKYAITDNVMKKTKLGQTVEKNNKRGAGGELYKNLTYLLK